MPLSVGRELGPYKIIAPIGKGGMGEVWKARDTRLDRIVAIKVSVAKFSERFEREAKAIAALNHPNICQIYDVGPDYIVMEYTEGAPVSRPDTPRKLLDMAVQMSDGLAAAHAAGIVPALSATRGQDGQMEFLGNFDRVAGALPVAPE
jgi:eukaryotic-like serine/threonine-protein kinase